MSSDAEQDIVSEILSNAALTPDHLLPALLDIQARLGYVPPACITMIARHFNLSRADVYGVASFYHDLRATPRPLHVVEICQAEACQAVGCRALVAHAQARLGDAAASNVAIEAAYCFGNCACGPTVRIGDTIHGRVTPERFDELVAALPGTRP